MKVVMILQTRKILHFNFKYNLKDLGFQQAFNTLNTFQYLAPIGKYIEGKFNSTLILDGILDQNLMPKIQYT